MGIFDFLFKKKEAEDITIEINKSLKNSFSNVKKDILNLYENNAEQNSITNSRFAAIEKRLERIEANSSVLSSYIREIKKYHEAKEEVIEEPEEELEVQRLNEQDNIGNVLKNLPRAELKLFIALHELQQNLNAKQISYKSLASYLYPEKEYNSIRSTITQFILRLYTEGMIDKQRIGKETYVKITTNGYKILKNAKIKKLIKEVELHESS